MKREELIENMSDEEADRWFSKLPVRLTHKQASIMFRVMYDLAIKEKREVTKKDMIKYLLSSPWLGEDEVDLEDAVTEVLTENSVAVNDVKTNKKDKALNSLVGLVMKKTKNVYDGKEVRKFLCKKLELTV